MKRYFVTHSSKDQGARGSTWVGQEVEEARGMHGQEPLLWLLRERQDKAVSLGSQSSGLNSLRRLWGLQVVSSCLVLGPGMIRAKECCLLKCRSQIQEGVMGPGLVGVHASCSIEQVVCCL